MDTSTKPAASPLQSQQVNPPVKTVAGPVSFASTVATNNISPQPPASSATGKTEPRTIIFGAYNSSPSTNSSQRSSPGRRGNNSTNGNYDSQKEQEYNGGLGLKHEAHAKKTLSSAPLVYIPRTQSAPPKENEIVPNPVPAHPPATTTAQSAQQPAGFHPDAPPYNPNAPIFMPGGLVSGPFYQPYINYGTVKPQSQLPLQHQIPPRAVQPFYSPSLSTSVTQPQQPEPPQASALPAKTPSKAIKIVDPNTKQELKLDTIPKISRPNASPELNLVASPSSATDAITEMPSQKVDPSPKKIIPIVNPADHRPIVVMPKESGDTFGAQSERDKAAEKETKSAVDEPLAAPSSPNKHLKSTDAGLAGVEEALEALTFDSSEEEFGESDEEEEYENSGLLRPGQTITYPERCIPFETPSGSGGIWKYSRRFLLQFMPVCTQKPDKASFFSRVARKDHSSQHGHRSRRHQRKILTEAERQALMMSLNRSEHAWARVADAQTLAEEERILREAKGILNKMTMEKFDALSDKIIALGITSQNVQGGMIDLLFDKSTVEPKFSSMYAMLCLKIAQKDLEESRSSPAPSVSSSSVSSASSSSKVESKFRRLLLEKCQYEFNNKRDWTIQRLSSSSDAAAEALPAAQQQAGQSGELTEEDYAKIRLKTRVLGNMRFIGELYMQGLISDKIMHKIVNELSKNVASPEDDEVECLCKMLSTVGKRMDHGESIPIMNLYMDRMRTLHKHPKLSSRIRFACLDVIELRGRGWLPKDVKPPVPIMSSASSNLSPQTSFSSLSASSNAMSSASDASQSRRPSRGDYREPSDSSATRGKPVKVAQRPADENDGWTTVSSNTNDSWTATATATSSKTPLNVMPSPKPAQLPQASKPKAFSVNKLRTAASSLSSPASTPTAVSPAQARPVAEDKAAAAQQAERLSSSSSDSLNRFQALEIEEPSISITTTSEDEAEKDPAAAGEGRDVAEPGKISDEKQSDDAVEKMIARVLSLYEEYVQLDNVKDILEAVRELPLTALQLFCRKLILKLLESQKNFLDHFPLFSAATRETLGEHWRPALRAITADADDLCVDIPTIFATLGSILRYLADQSLIASKDNCLHPNISPLGRFKICGHMSGKRLEEDFDLHSLPAEQHKQAALYALKHGWHNLSPQVAELAFRYRLSAISSSSSQFFFSSAKAVLFADFMQSALPPERGLSIILHKGLEELKGQSNPNGCDMLVSLVSPFLAGAVPKATLRHAIEGAGKDCDAPELSRALIKYLEDLNLIQD